MSKLWGLLTWLVLATGVWAQKGPVSTGTVTGRVLCGDTQLPARFAQVSLVRRPAKEELDTIFGPPEKEPGAGSMKRPKKPAGRFDILQEHTGLDGSYSIDKVPPGDYWVVAKREGYIFPIAPVGDQKEQRDLDRLLALAVPVHVDAERVAKADVVLERGGVVLGRAAFDDGSAAVDWNVWLVPVGAETPFPAENAYVGVSGAIDDARLGMTTTDDDGSFRMAGIPPGKYMVITQLEVASGWRVESESAMPESQGTQNLVVYAPGVFARDSARQIEIHGTETVRDADLKLDLRALRTIRGKVLARADGLPIPPGARVHVESGSYAQQAEVQRDGSFHLDYLPPGTYTLGLIPSFPDGKDRTRHYERPAPQKVVVGEDDVTVDDILLSEKKPDKAKD